MPWVTKKLGARSPKGLRPVGYPQPGLASLPMPLPGRWPLPHAEQLHGATRWELSARWGPVAYELSWKGLGRPPLLKVLPLPDTPTACVKVTAASNGLNWMLYCSVSFYTVTFKLCMTINIKIIHGLDHRYCAVIDFGMYSRELTDAFPNLTKKTFFFCYSFRYICSQVAEINWTVVCSSLPTICASSVRVLLHQAVVSSHEGACSHGRCRMSLLSPISLP